MKRKPKDKQIVWYLKWECAVPDMKEEITMFCFEYDTQDQWKFNCFATKKEAIRAKKAIQKILVDKK